MSKILQFAFLQFAACFIFQGNGFAVEFEFIGNHSQIIYQGEMKMEPNQSVGSFTLQVLKEAKAKKILDFQGNEAELRSINNLSSDSTLEDYEIISDEEMNTYGWCFKVDSILPESTPDKVYFASNASKLRWYYAYAHYNRGWKDWCIPAN